MKIQLLIAANESDYSEYLSNVLSMKYADTFVVGTCSSEDKLEYILSAKKHDVVLVEPEWVPALKGQNVKLALALWSGQSSLTEAAKDTEKVHKYQRISTLVSDILEHYARVAPGYGDFDKNRGQIVAVWSPAGGVGKTTVALAVATRAVSNGKTATYLDMEHFSSTDAYFTQEGKSISTLYEKLSLNAEILLRSIRLHDSGSGIDYFIRPNNYDDVNELKMEDWKTLVTVCANTSDVVVVDLPSICDWRTQAVLDLADIVFIVSDGSRTAASKLNIFVSQHGVFENIRHKARLISNRGAKLVDPRFDMVIGLPRVQTDDPVSVFKTLSGNAFGM